MRVGSGSRSPTLRRIVGQNLGSPSPGVFRSSAVVPGPEHFRHTLPLEGEGDAKAPGFSQAPVPFGVLWKPRLALSVAPGDPALSRAEWRLAEAESLAESAFRATSESACRGSYVVHRRGRTRNVKVPGFVCAHKRDTVFCSWSFEKGYGTDEERMPCARSS